jgi:hypothetical protein
MERERGISGEGGGRERREDAIICGLRKKLDVFFFCFQRAEIKRVHPSTSSTWVNGKPSTIPRRHTLLSSPTCALRAIYDDLIRLNC